MTCVRVKAAGRAWTVCYSDERLIVPNPDCPNAANHTPHPAGYLAHDDWAMSMLDTHDQQQCTACGLWAIWTPKPTGAVAGAAPTTTNPTA